MLFAKKKFFENRQKTDKKPTKTDKNRQKPILIFGPLAQPTKTDSEKGRRFTSQARGLIMATESKLNYFLYR